MNLLRSSFSSVMYGGIRWFGKPDEGIRILGYHRVNNDERNYTTVRVSDFRTQLQFLSEAGYQTISLDDLVDGRLKAKSIVITFDDGYRDIYEYAYPILKGFGFSATVFCIGEQIGEASYLGWEDIEEMRRDGFEFGSHTLVHPDLRFLKQEEKWREIFGSKKFLEERFGLKVNFFCYPFGLYDGEVINMVKKAGYMGACSNLPGANKKINPYLLRRTEIAAQDTLDDFKKKLAGAYDFLHQALHQLRGRP
ncbi:MAG: polysaccharide deacetylase family protein [Candidatus Omnitrophica bacterium]|nr:polysaccharide deacetylase family protein [Candidatus Omnitrophota bacterium]